MIETALLKKDGIYTFTWEVAPEDAETLLETYRQKAVARFGGIEKASFHDQVVTLSFRAASDAEARAFIADCVSGEDRGRLH